MSNKIFITGAAGKIGSQLVKILKEKDADFAAGVTSTEKSIEGVESIVFNYADYYSMVSTMKGIHSLFLLTPFIPSMQEWSENAVRAAKEAGVSYIVRLSVAKADIDSDVLFLKIQGEIDKVVKESGLAYTILGPTSFMQNFTSLYLPTIIEQNAIYLPQGDGKIGYIHTGDVAAVAAEVLLNQEKHQSQIYLITGGEALSIADVAAIISEVTDKDIKYVDISEEAYEKSLKDMGIPQILIDQWMSLFKTIKAGYATEISPAVKEITGSDPITFRQFALENAEIWK